MLADEAVSWVLQLLAKDICHRQATFNRENMPFLKKKTYLALEQFFWFSIKETAFVFSDYRLTQFS